MSCFTFFKAGERASSETSGEGGYGFGGALPVNSSHVLSIEEAARLLNATAPVRLPTRIPADMTYMRIIVSSEDTIYVYYADEPIAEEDNPFVLIHLHWGWTYADIEGGAPDTIVLISKLAPDTVQAVADINSEETAREYAEEFNLTYRMVDGIAVFGYEPQTNRVFIQPVGVVHFYIGDVWYEIMSRLSYEEVVEIARSIIEQFLRCWQQ
ncbi:hypothetical protein KEJ27_02390 [Candidatus Bathyarchaeota archaeon]|nr:hypothetical protein [Candidatus Bathyarchaeota archaeon]